MRRSSLYLVFALVFASGWPAAAQSIGGGTVAGTVLDPSGGAIAGASVEMRNPLTGYTQTTQTDTTGSFQFTNVPRNPYHLEITAPGFTPTHQDLTLRTAVPLRLSITLPVAGGETSITVEADAPNTLENVPYAHNDLDAALSSKLPAYSPGSGLSDAITLASPGVVADSNGFFHPLGDHAQTLFSIDGQPIGDQQSKGFSTQIPLDALQSMELITGAPSAEFGDKTSLIVNATTRSGLGLAKPTGSLVAQYGSFGTVGEQATFAAGTPKFGNFLAANALRSGRFLDTPEFHPMHDIGNNENVFDRMDFQPDGENVLHLNLFAAHNWFQIPNTYDQPNQDQRQQVRTLNAAPGFQHTFNAHTLFTINSFFRKDWVDDYPSRDPFQDLPATIALRRQLANYGVKADVSYVRGAHNIKIGTQLMQTHLNESFNLGITDPAFNSGPNLLPGLLPFDLTRGGHPLNFAGEGNINEYALYLEDSITLGHLTLSPGLRVDRYDGISTATAAEPRLGVSYLFKPTRTVLRVAYSRTLETPYNENLLLSSATGLGGLAAGQFGAFGVQPLKAGRRSQYNAGLQQNLGRFLQVDADYFWKYTENAYDFDTLFSTPITFPISWRKSKLDGVAVRLNTPVLHGFQAYTTMGHTRARYFPPETGGLIFNSPVDTSVFRIDHDEAFEQTTNLRYQRPHNGPWFAFTWRYDSGLVAGSVATLADALALTAAQQAAIGFFCDGQTAALGAPITSCTSPNWGATRLRIPAPGTANPDHNPPRVLPRHLFNVSVGSDNLLHTEPVHVTLRFSVLNLGNTVALYNFLSTFSGTHFVPPRTYQAELGFAF
jgi:hypothetical protein